MKYLYTFSVLSVLFLTGCSKDVFRSYDDRIVGTWRITEINRLGFGSNENNLPFQEGSFTFQSGGGLAYVHPTAGTYQGSWDLIKKQTGEEIQRGLQITVVNFSTQQILTHYYDDMDFSGTDHFKARSEVGIKNFMTHFRR